MTTLISKFMSTAASFIPGTTAWEAKQPKREDLVRTVLNRSLNSQAPNTDPKLGTTHTISVLDTKVAETIKSLNEKKQECEDDLRRLNGDYYQDPKSLLKQTWDKLVQKIHNVLGIHVKSDQQLAQVITQLDSSSSPDADGAKRSITGFNLLKAKRDKIQTDLNTILATERASKADYDSTLIVTRQNLEQRYLTLCGLYFQDPKGQLHQAWNLWKTAEASKASDTGILKADYEQLNDERQQIEAQLYRIHQRLTLAPTKSYSDLATDLISAQIHSANPQL